MAVNRARRSDTSSVIAPTGGLNDLNSIANMPVTDALILENWFPRPNTVDVRGGCTEHVTGLPVSIETLMAYNGIASAKLFAASGTAIYDVTTAGAVGAAVVSGKSNARWDQVLFGGAAGNFLALVNGVDLPMFYDGSTWTPSGTGYATAITGVVASTFSQVSAWKNRLFFVEKNTLRCWFLGTQAIGGVASSIDFAGVAKLGGHLVAIVSINSTAGVTLDDYFCAITSEGECLVYRGTDPTQAATFAIVGNYRIGRPIAPSAGGRWLAKLGSDVIAITAEGLVSLKDAISSDVVAQNKTISNKIINTVGDDAAFYKTNFGWQIILSPISNKLIINIPTNEDVSSRQYVMNTITNAWCKFTGWDATCFEYFNDVLYSAIGTKVYKMDVDGSNDFVSATSNGTPITAVAQTAYQYFGGASRKKSFKLVRPLIQSKGAINYGVGINIDFRQIPITGSSVSSLNSNTNSKWGPGFMKWGPGFGKWAEELAFSQNWINVSGYGYAASLQLRVVADNQTVKWQGWNIIHERGGLI